MLKSFKTGIEAINVAGRNRCNRPSFTLVFNLPKGAANEVASVDLNGGAIIASEADATMCLAQLTLPVKIAEK